MLMEFKPLTRAVCNSSFRTFRTCWDPGLSTLPAQYDRDWRVTSFLPLQKPSPKHHALAPRRFLQIGWSGLKLLNEVQWSAPCESIWQLRSAFLRDPAKDIQEKHALESTRQHGTILLDVNDVGNCSPCIMKCTKNQWKSLTIELFASHLHISGLISCSSTRTKTVMMPTAIPLEI